MALLSLIMRSWLKLPLHFEGLLGTSVERLHSLDLDFLGIPSEDLSELEVAFTEDKVWEVIRHLPSSKGA
jgi:hypothetical protein